MVHGNLCRFLRIVTVTIAMLMLSGCYYTQATLGHFKLMQKREQIDTVIASTDTPEELARRLTLVQQARRFSIDVLKLPDNASYSSYADVQRDFVVWNVIAAPEFSLQPKRWCYPVAGCVSYRGYFAEEKARRLARKLDGQGYDVVVGGVAAYSTLGKFSDPVISTMMRWDDVELVGVLFHELAHQRLYVKGDSAFNESFATAVEEFGVVRWLQARGEEDTVEAYRQRRSTRRQLMALVSEARKDLEVYYAETIDDDEKRLLKEHRLELLQEQARAALQTGSKDPNHWLSGELNNARLVSLMLYEGKLPEFRALLDDCEQNIECFYDSAKALSAR